MVHGYTLGILAARVLLAGINAATVQAITELRWRTILVVLTDMGTCCGFG